MLAGFVPAFCLEFKYPGLMLYATIAKKRFVSISLRLRVLEIDFPAGNLGAILFVPKH